MQPFGKNIMSQNSQTVNELIDRQMRLTKNKQMTEEEYRYIASYLGSKNTLIFGTGYDSDLWRQANNHGNTIFLEDNDKWISHENDVYKVTYKTVLSDAEILLSNYKKTMNDNLLLLDLPQFVKDTKWDIIVVDAPAGNKLHLPGRMQSIFTAKKLSNKNTNIFVHDCDRKVEDLYTTEFLGKPKKQLTKLRHFVCEK